MPVWLDLTLALILLGLAPFIVVVGFALSLIGCQGLLPKHR